MDKSEYRAFVEQFKTITTESTKNGGGQKLRFKSESTRMLQWLEARV